MMVEGQLAQAMLTLPSREVRPVTSFCVSLTASLTQTAIQRYNLCAASLESAPIIQLLF